MKQLLALLLLTSLLSFGCSEASDDSPPAAPDAGTADATPEPDASPPNPSPAIETLDQDGWNEILPGGDTICSRGTEFAYYVHPGTTNKVIIDFIGGGACWNSLTCSVADSIFSDSVEGVRAVVRAGVGIGIYDREREENPFKDWTHIIIPYCTGDIHWGNQTTTYGEGDRAVTINHRGAVNTRAVLDCVRQYRGSEQIFVTGARVWFFAWSAYIMSIRGPRHSV